MPDLNRLIAGLRCRDVLALLGEYIEGELPADSRERIEAHVRGCEQCEKFGGEYAQFVSMLRSHQRSGAGTVEIPTTLTARLTRLWADETAHGEDVRPGHND